MYVGAKLCRDHLKYSNVVSLKKVNSFASNQILIIVANYDNACFMKIKTLVIFSCAYAFYCRVNFAKDACIISDNNNYYDSLHMVSEHSRFFKISKSYGKPLDNSVHNSKTRQFSTFYKETKSYIRL